VDTTNLNETDIQLAIYTWRHHIQAFPLIITNIFFYNWWECDALYITKSGYCHEFEIKISHSDFISDLAKPKHGKIRNGTGPSKFYYVCPPDIISLSEVPEHTGLAYVRETRGIYIGEPDRVLSLDIIKEPPTHKREKISDSKWIAIAYKANARYWKLRTAEVNI